MMRIQELTSAGRVENPGLKDNIWGLDWIIDCNFNGIRLIGGHGGHSK
jgi:hypothetical protein